MEFLIITGKALLAGLGIICLTYGVAFAWHKGEQEGRFAGQISKSKR